ncbi:MAG: HAD hydrolase-like protein [Bradyrhizobiaceae bacterium]|nr:HAD hydrolase-like protein [Bradyrhizobiaceae bacterium]
MAERPHVLDTGPIADIRARLAAVRGFVLDLDGTLALGDRRGQGLVPIAGAHEFVERLNRTGTPYTVFTNGTLRTPKETAEKLRAAGFNVPDDRAMTPSSVAADYFARRKISPVLVLGCEGVWRPLKEAGVEVVLPAEYHGNVSAVYVGWYREFTMPCVEAAFDAVMNGAKLFSASNVPFFAASGGRALGTSFMICTMLKGLTKKTAKVLGKPSAEALQFASRQLGLPQSQIAIVGDDPLCEIRLAHYGQALGVGVTTGTASRSHFEAQRGRFKPHLIIDNLGELVDATPLGNAS